MWLLQSCTDRYIYIYIYIYILFIAVQGIISHYNDVIMITSQITSLTIIFSTVYLDTDQRKNQSSASLAFVRGIHQRPVNSPHKWPVTRKMFPFDDVTWYMSSWLISRKLFWFEFISQLSHWGRYLHMCRCMCKIVIWSGKNVFCLFLLTVYL